MKQSTQLAHLDSILSNRDGSPVLSHDRESSFDSKFSILAYEVTPQEIVGLISHSLSKKPFVEEHGQFGSTVSAKLSFGILQMSSATPEYAWNESSPTEQLLLKIVFYDNLKIFDPNLFNQICNETCITLTSRNGQIMTHSMQTLKGGRTLHNLLFTLIQFSLDSEKLYRKQFL